MKTFRLTLSPFAFAGSIIVSILLSGCNKSTGADPVKVKDLVVYGKIFTAAQSDGADSIARAFVVKEGKFVYVGTEDGAAKYVTPDMEVVNVDDGSLVIPGCTEGHGHFIGVEGVATTLPGFKASYESLVDTVIPKKMQSDPGPFVSFGWATAKVPKDNKTDYAGTLDEISTEYPIILIDGGGHNALCNTPALKKAGLLADDGTKKMDVRGGDILTLGETGKPTGYITDEVIPYVVNKAVGALLDDAQYRQACINAVNALNERGFTCYLDAATNYLDEEARAYKYAYDLDQSGEFTVNMIGFYNIRSYDWGFPKGGPIPETVKKRLDYISTLVDKYSSRHVIANGVKLFADGVTDTGTGWISEEYLKDLPADKKHGNIIWEQEELDAIVAASNERGFPVHTHTFGDLACEAVINAYCASRTASSLTVPNSLAHVRNIMNKDIARCAENDILIASNIIWHVGDPDWAMPYLAHIPKDIYESGYPMKSLMDAGIVVTSSTDSPAGTTPGTVPNIIGVAVNGVCPEFLDVNPLNASELLTVAQALKCLTINGAISLGLQEERGSIEVGKYADFVVLDKDVLEQEKTNKKDIFNTKVESTWFEGRKVYPNTK
ncbi:MAG: amidohydrolase family protein [Bacteroidales bacterium]|nr:amidohydrolase family protein [Bacteroidales bacterium]